MRVRRHLRLRQKVKGTAQRPRLCVNRTLRHIHAQLIDDQNGQTLAAATTVQSDVAAQVGELKERAGGTISVLGSVDLAQTLMHHDLVDEYSLAIHPLVLGKGKKLFRDSDQLRTLQLVDVRPTTTGVLLTTYRAIR